MAGLGVPGGWVVFGPMYEANLIVKGITRPEIRAILKSNLLFNSIPGDEAQLVASPSE